MDIEVYQNINCGVPPQDNKYWAQHKLVGQFAVNPRTTVPPNSVNFDAGQTRVVAKKNRY